MIGAETVVVPELEGAMNVLRPLSSDEKLQKQYGDASTRKGKEKVQ